MKTKSLKIFLFLTAGFFSLVFSSSAVFADSVDSEYLDRVLEKSILTGAYQCYQKNRLRSPIEYGDIGKFSDDIIQNDQADIKVPTSAYDLTQWYQIWGQKTNLTCDELFTGYGDKFHAVMRELQEADFSDFRNVVVNHNDMIDSFMTGLLGYKSSIEGVSDTQCIEIFFWTDNQMFNDFLTTVITGDFEVHFNEKYKTTALLCNNNGDTLSSNTKLSVNETAFSTKYPIKFTPKEGKLEIDCLSEDGFSIVDVYAGSAQHTYSCPTINFSDVGYSLEKLAAKIYQEIISTGEHGKYTIAHVCSYPNYSLDGTYLGEVDCSTYDNFRILAGQEIDNFQFTRHSKDESTKSDKIVTMSDGTKTGAVITGAVPLTTYSIVKPDSANHFISVASDMTSTSGTAFSGLNYYTKFGNATALKYNRLEQLVLYQWYIEHFYYKKHGGDIRCYEPNELNRALVDSYKDEGYVEVPLYIKSKKGFHENCLVQAGTSDKVNGLGSDNMFGGSELSFSDLVNKIKEIALVFSSGLSESQVSKIGDAIGNIGIVDDLSQDSPISVADMNTGIDSDAESQCDQAGSSLGWIICPLIELIANATTSMYIDTVEPFLNIDSTILSTSAPSAISGVDKTNAVAFAWNIFQNFANIALVIILLVIIFSQLTGVGIDNYGIKKALPKLIIAILLINLSFIICQLAVDLSNILGSSLYSLFDGLAKQIGLNPDFSQNGMKMAINSNSGSLANAAVLGTGGLAVIGCIAAIYFGGWTVILAVLPAILGGLIAALVAIFFFFVLLGARQAGVIILVAIAPIAIVCYILPNTKKFFDKWVKLFTALLMLYPIAGALMGAGSFASTLLLEAGGVGSGTKDEGGFWYTLAAMLVGVIPFFLIPSLLKGSFALMGNLGAKISGIGSRVGGRLSGGAKRASNNAINSSDRVQTARAEHARNRQTRSAQRMIDRVNAKGDRATAQDRLRAARAQQVLNRQTSEDIEAEVGISPLDRGVLLSQAQLKRENADIEATESNIMNSDHADDFVALQRGLETAILSGDTIGIRAYQNVLSRKGEDGRQAVHNAMANAETTARNNGTTVSDAARRAYSSNLMNKWAGDYKNYSRSTFAYASRNTGATANGTIESYQASVVSGLKQEQMATMDGAELQRYADRLQSGTMSAEDSASLRRLAYDTLHNAQLQGSIKGSQRTILESMAQGYTPPAPAPAPAPSPSPSPAPAPAPSPAPAPPRPRLETFESESAADAAFNEELRRQRNNEKNRGKGGSGIILP
ncbi:type IV secretion system protein [Candidatus Saccharibacteria bacterium]|nr:type IV secretion system protein [Candidatus Saccharibacteria bacterium]